MRSVHGVGSTLISAPSIEYFTKAIIFKATARYVLFS